MAATPRSRPATVGSGTPPPPGGSQTLTPVADAHVKSTSTTSNYGTLTSLRLRNGGTSSDTYRSYLKFDVSGLSGAATSAKLRLFVTDESPDGGSVSKVGNDWTETGITWANAPAPGATSLGGGATANGTWAEIDVTSAVTANGPVSFALTTASSNSSYYTSRRANKPQLVIGGSGPPPPGVAPTADFTATPTSGTAPLDVAFADASAGSPTSWSWDFQNDGTVDSTQANPRHVHPARQLRREAHGDEINVGGSDEVKAGHVTVGSGLPPPSGGTRVLGLGRRRAREVDQRDEELRRREPAAPAQRRPSDTYRSYLKFDVTGSPRRRTRRSCGCS